MHKWIIDGKEALLSGEAKIHWHNTRFFEIDYKDQKFNAELLSYDVEKAIMQIKINHRIFKLKRENRLSELIKSMGLDKVKIKKLLLVEAPMPGRVIEVFVKPGDVVNPGDSLLSLEAMKMENILKSEGAGEVEKIEVVSNQVVEKGFVLIRFK